MSIFKIMNYAKGYLTVRIEGLNLEKFLNMSVAHGITFRDIRRISMTELELKVSIRGYLRLKRFVKKTGSKVSITGKDGLPFFFLRLKKRKTMAIGFMVFILLVLVLSSFIWSVEIVGANTVSTEQIRQNLYELGVKPGMLKLKLSVSEIENNMLIRMSKLSWIKIKLVGTRAEVEVKERTIPDKAISDQTPCNIVAKRDGIITKIVSAKGDVLVSQGEPVKKGQLLVTGVIERPNIETRYVHSIAEIRGRAWYEGQIAVPLESVSKVRSGSKVERINLVVGSNVFPIKKANIPYKNYDKIIKSANIIDTDKFQLPIKIVIEEYHETTDKITKKTPEEAKAEARDEVEKSIMDKLPPDAKIINKNFNISIKDNVAIAIALIETIEDLGMEEEISMDGRFIIDREQ